MDILSQVLGAIALILSVWSFFEKNNCKFLMIEIIANFFMAGSYILVDAYVGGVVILVSLVRCVYLLLYNKYNLKHLNFMLVVFALAYITVAILFWKDAWDIIPLITAIVFTVAFSIKNMQKVRLISMPPCLLLTVYSIIVGAYANALLDFVIFIFMLVSFVINTQYFILLRTRKAERTIENTSNKSEGLLDNNASIKNDKTKKSKTILNEKENANDAITQQNLKDTEKRIKKNNNNKNQSPAKSDKLQIKNAKNLEKNNKNNAKTSDKTAKK